MKISDVVGFRKDLFFGGAVQLDWLEDDIEKAEFASQNFVFHGPEYHGVVSDNGSGGYKLTDTATFTDMIIDNIIDTEKEEGISLAIAGYGTGKSHLGLTLATLLSTNNEQCKASILKNIKYADKDIAENIESNLTSITKPQLIITLNGMKDFNLSSELSRQTINIIRNNNLPTEPLEDLWPRFHIASEFCQRNFSVRKDLFEEHVAMEIDLEEILVKLNEHNEEIFEKINIIYYQIVGSYINAMGQESPQELIKTISKEYCGPNGYFQGILIIFDEFGRYLEFAAEKPQIAGDAAIQQLFEAVQNNLEKTFLLCFNQYELRTYLSRIASDLQITLQRYITRFDSAKKYYLSTNLETLFAHLIEKKNPEILQTYLEQPVFKSNWVSKRGLISSAFNLSKDNALWQDKYLFEKVVVQGCWPLDPLATWMLSNLNDILQNRSSIAIIKSALDRISGSFDSSQMKNLSAVDVAQYGLVDEFLANEKNGYSGSDTEIFLTIKDRIGHNLSDYELQVLLAILIANKLKVTLKGQIIVNQLLSSLCNINETETIPALKNLTDEFGVLEWNSTQNKYDLIGDAIPRSKFLNFLDQNVQQISGEKIENIFVSNALDWSRISPIKSSFSNIKKISTTEWDYNVKTTNLHLLQDDISKSYAEWQLAIAPDQKRGTILYCYISQLTKEENALRAIGNEVLNVCKNANIPVELFPFYIVPIYDYEGEYAKCIAEYFVLTGNIPSEQKIKFSHFIEDHKSFLKDELSILFDKLRKNGNRKCFFHPEIQNEFSDSGLRTLPTEIFTKIYQSAFSFIFDGFNTTRGNAAKDCREITIALIQGSISSDWLNSKNTQFKNRYRTLLVNGPSSWQALDERGAIRLYPLHPQVNIIIRDLENRLEIEKEISLSSIVGNWIKPPFGLNIASVGILLGIFLIAREENINILYYNKAISRSNWIIDLFKKNFLDLYAIRQTKFIYIEEKDTNKWKKLLEEWGTTNKYRDKIQFEEKSEELESNLGAPSEVLYHKRALLIERNNEAKDQISKKLYDIDELERLYMQAKENSFCQQLIFASDKATRIRLEMNKNNDKWDELDIEPFTNYLEKATDLIKVIFDEWLDKLYVGNVSQLEKFEKTNKNLSRILRELDYEKLSFRLDDKIRSLTTHLNHQKKIGMLLDTISNFQNTHYYTAKTPIQEINEIIKKSQGFISDLKIKAKMEDNKAPLIKIKELQKDLIEAGEIRKKKHINKLSKYYELESFSTIEEVELAKDELQILKMVFQGKDTDLEDIESMLSQVNQFSKGLKFIEDNKNKLTITSLQENIDYLSKVYEKSINPDSEILWSFDETIGPIFKNIKEQIIGLSSLWISQNRVEEENIINLTASECTTVLRKISEFPQYLTDKDQKLVSKWNILLQDRMSKTKIDGVIVLFDELDDDLKGECLEKLKNRLNEGNN